MCVTLNIQFILDGEAFRELVLHDLYSLPTLKRNFCACHKDRIFFTCITDLYDITKNNNII